MTLQHLRSSTANKRPDPTAMADGQIALNTAAASPGLFYKDSAGNLVKAGPVHVGSTAPNVSPASGGTAGNSTGESWLDTSGSNPLLKIWSGAAWQTVQPVASGTVVSTADTGSVTSAMIANGTIVDADVNASAAIAGTKISPNFGSQNVTTTGTVTGASLIPSSSTVPTNGLYLPSANSVALSTNSVGRLFIDDQGRVGVGVTAVAGVNFNVQGSSPVFRVTGASATSPTFQLSAAGVTNWSQVVDASNSSFYISKDGTERLRITSAGLVGVGTSSPVAGAQLTVAGSALAVTGQNTDHSANSIRIGEEGSGAAQIRCYGPNTSTNGSLTFRMSRSDGSNSQDVVIDGSGRLGIGTSAPGQQLSITTASNDDGIVLTNSSANGGRVRLNSTGTGGRAYHIISTADGSGLAGGKFVITDNTASDAARFVIDSSGRVGIGVTAPEQSLHIGGNNGIRFGNAGATPKGDISYTSSGAEFLDIKIQGTTSGFGNIRFSTGGTPSEACRIDASGRLLVGTSSTATVGDSQYAKFQVRGNTISDTGILSIQRASAASSSGNAIGSIFFTDNTGNDYASITVAADATPGSGDYPGRLVFSTTADGASSPTERMRITSSGYLKASNTGSYFGGNYHEFSSNDASSAILLTRATSASFADNVTAVGCLRSANSAYRLFAGYSGDGSSNLFSDLEVNLRGDGNGYCDGAWTGGGADYAEYFEWSDGNPDAEDRRGISVVLDGDKIREAQPDEDPIGVISGNPSVVGDAAWNKWSGKYLRDEYGTYIQEDYEVTDDDGNTVIQQRRKLNPAYDPDVEYISREQRPEWDCVGLMGKLRIRKGQATGSRWIKMRDISDSVEEWLVR